MSVDKRIGLHSTPAVDRQVIIFWCFFHTLASHVMHPGQDACLAAQAGGRHGSLHILANCGQSVKLIWNEDDGTSLQRKQPRPEPKCFKWITPVCHCDYTLLAGTATRWIVFYGFTADLFSFFSPPTWMHFFSLLCSVVWIWDCFCLWTTPQTVYLLVFLKGTFSFYLRVDWQIENPCMCIHFHQRLFCISKILLEVTSGIMTFQNICLVLNLSKLYIV